MNKLSTIETLFLQLCVTESRFQSIVTNRNYEFPRKQRAIVSDGGLNMPLSTIVFNIKLKTGNLTLINAALCHCQQMLFYKPHYTTSYNVPPYLTYIIQMIDQLNK